VLEVFSRYRDGAAVMVSSGRSAAILQDLGEREGVAFMTGMTCTGAACFGLAMARPDLKVVALQGDGSVLMALPELVTIGRYQPRNLVVLVINNRLYRSTGGGQLATASAARADIAALGRAAGIERSVAVDTVEEADRCLREAMQEEGPFLVVANVDGTLVLDPERPSATEDRVEMAVAFQRYLRATDPGRGATATAARAESEFENASLSAVARAIDAALTELVAEAEDPTVTPAAREIYAALREAGIDFCVYLPESILYPVQALAERDPTLLTVCCTREDEGVAIAGGAAAAGRWPVVVMEGSGVGMSGLSLGHMLERRAPMLILSSHSENLGFRAAHDNISCIVNEPILRALHVRTTVLAHRRDAGLVIRESMRSARVLKQPVAVVVPPYVMHED
jgi:thiamine pyrophosphate-dependent acetolactate synthase large subunit-like protein